VGGHRCENFPGKGCIDAGDFPSDEDEKWNQITIKISKNLNVRLYACGIKTDFEMRMFENDRDTPSDFSMGSGFADSTDYIVILVDRPVPVGSKIHRTGMEVHLHVECAGAVSNVISVVLR
jgi:hypothetical protein